MVIYYYELYLLEVPGWKKNLWKQLFIVLLVLIFFAHPRILAISLITEKYVWEMSARQYIHAFFSQITQDLAIYASIMAIIFADKANSRRKEKELLAASMEFQNKELQNQLTSAQLEALKLQLNPHFLFNTLNTVSSLIRAGEYSLAIQVNARLGSF